MLLLLVTSGGLPTDHIRAVRCLHHTDSGGPGPRQIRWSGARWTPPGAARVLRPAPRPFEPCGSRCPAFPVPVFCSPRTLRGRVRRSDLDRPLPRTTRGETPGRAAAARFSPPRNPSGPSATWIQRSATTGRLPRRRVPHAGRRWNDTTGRRSGPARPSESPLPGPHACGTPSSVRPAQARLRARPGPCCAPRPAVTTAAGTRASAPRRPTAAPARVSPRPNANAAARRCTDRARACAGSDAKRQAWWTITLRTLRAGTDNFGPIREVLTRVGAA